jgi:hypothetical protein
MKIIGSVIPEIIEPGELANAEYAGGVIVMLTEREAAILASLQIVWDGDIFKFPNRPRDIEEREMSNAFCAVRSFVEAKFAINEFRNSINNLDDMIKGSKRDEL